MPENSPKRWNIWTPILVFFLLSLGILIGYFIKNLEVESQSPNPTFVTPTVVQRYDRIEEIISIIGDGYFMPISQDSLFNLAINSIFGSLDPHSTYIPLSEKTTFQNSLDGNFKGVGVEFAFVNDTVVFTHIIPNSPAEEAQLQAGDLLIKVDNEIVSGIGMDSDQLIDFIVGEGGTSLSLDILRLPNRIPQTIQAKRGNVPLTSIDAYYLLDNNVGYIKINRFSATTYREFTSALKELQSTGMESLIIDLRQNPGGYLEAAVAIADELLSDKKVIVSTENRIYGNEDYFSEMEGLYEEGPLAVLIDEGSASASEILAGAIQDWDRGWIIGRRSFGKGLVQEVFDLNDGSSIKLTTSRYLTPTGRDIQRPYLKNKKSEASFSSEFPIYKDEVHHSIITNNIILEDTTLFLTKTLKRQIYGGGGIKPDILVPFENREEYLGELYNILISNTIRTAAYKYYIYHSSDIKKYKGLEDFTTNFKLPDFVLDQLLADFNKENPQNTITKWPNTKAKEFIKGRISNLIARMEYGPKGYFYYQHQKDKGLQKAIQQLKTKPHLQPIN